MSNLLYIAYRAEKQRISGIKIALNGDVMEIPNSQACMLPLLKFAADGLQHSQQEATDALAEHFQLPPEKRTQLRESGVNILYNTVAWAKSFLKQANLLEYPVRGMLQITEEGKKVLESDVQYIDFKYLERFPSFVEFQNRKGTRTTFDGSSESAEQFPIPNSLIT